MSIELEAHSLTTKKLERDVVLISPIDVIEIGPQPSLDKAVRRRGQDHMKRTNHPAKNGCVTFLESRRSNANRHPFVELSQSRK